MWFTFPEAWRDMGGSTTPPGSFTGLYVSSPGGDVPLAIGPAHWATTDLFLDLWQAVGHDLLTLNQKDRAAVRAAGHFDRDATTRVRLRTA